MADCQGEETLFCISHVSSNTVCCTCLFSIALIPGQIVLPLLATEEVTTLHLVSMMNPDFSSPPSSYSMSKCVQSDDRKVDMTRQPDMKMNQNE